MAIPIYLQNLKSSGVYTFEFDESQIVTTTNSTIRLLIGFSKIGPFNTPVYCQDLAFFTGVYGPRDKKLERQGSYFHLFAETMLAEAPIICLSLLDLDDELDQTEFISFSTAADDANQPEGSAPLSGNYNTSKFWKLDRDKALRNINNQEGYTNSLLNFVNVGTRTVSVVVTQANIQGLDIAAKDWYGEADVPEFMDGSDYINDYAVRVNVISGDFTDYETLSVDPILGDYFDTNGLKKTFVDSNGNEFDGLEAFLENPNVVSLAEYSGVLIPDFQDRNNEDLYIQDIINLETAFTGIFCLVDEDAFDGTQLLSGDQIDLLGGTIESDSSLTRIDFLSYLGSIKEDLAYTASDYDGNEVFFSANTVDNYGSTAYTGSADAQLTLTDANAYPGATAWFDTLTVYSPDSTDENAPGKNPFTSHDEWLAFALSITEDVSFLQCSSVVKGGASAGNTTMAIVKDVALFTDKISIQIDSSNQADTETLFFNGTTLSTSSDLLQLVYPSIEIQALDNGGYLFTASSDAGIDFVNGVISSGDTVQVTGGSYEEFTILSKVADGNGDELDGLLGPDILSHPITYYTLTPVDTPANTFTMNIKSLTGSINQSFTVNKINDYEFTYSVGATSPYSTGDIIPSDFLIRSFDTGTTKTEIDPRTGKTRFTRIESVKEDTVKQIVTVKTVDPVYFGTDNQTVERYKSVQNFVENYNLIGLDGFTMREEQMPNGTTERQNEIYGVLTDTGLFNTLADKEAISFRYVIDSFEGTIEPNSKSVLSSLCKTRQFAFAIVNAPSVKQFDESTNPLFKFNSRSDYDPRYVPDGGNQDFNPDNTFTLPTLNQGSNYVGFYHPNLVLREGASSKLVPPAAYISNNYVTKYRTGQPYDIIAGPRRGVVAGDNITGVEYVYDRTGLDFVEPFGLNVIVPSRGFGNVINAEQTAQQNIKSALSTIHVRELLIYIEETVESILKNYRWEFNTVQTRLEIKTLVDGFLGGIQNDGGLTNFTTVMNTVNNTPEIIDNDMGVIDIAVEPVRGLGKLVQRVTILRTGAIERGEFQLP